MELEIEAVHQPQGPELVLAERPREAALRLLAILRGALGDEAMIELVIAVHGASLRRLETAAQPFGLLAEIGADRWAEGADALADVERPHPPGAPIRLEPIGSGDQTGCDPPH